MFDGSSWTTARHSEPEIKVTNFQLFKLVVIGIGRFIGGSAQFWNSGLVMGKYPYLGATIWYGVACICLAFSLAELVSALPFSGGLYGYVRGLMGPYYGFICAVFELYCNIAAIALYLMGFGAACVTALDIPAAYQLIFFIVPFVICASLHFSGKKVFWRGAMVITTISLALIALYILASIYNIRWHTYHANNDAVQPNPTEKAQKVVNWQGGPSLFFAGEYLVPALVAREEHHSISAAPKTILWTTFSVVFIAVAIVYLSTLQAPGVTVLQDASLPLSFAFSNAFNISYNAASCLNIPISLASFVIAMYYMIAILKAMASSGLLPVRLLRTMGNEQTPYEAIRVTYMGAVLITMIYIASAVAGPFYALMMYTLSTFYLYSLWIGLMVAYLMFKRKYASLKRSFRSPLGVWGAYIAIFSAVQHFVTQFYPIHSYSIAPFIVFVLSMVVLTVVYHRYIIKYQKYSEEEERVFFVTYIVTANRRSQERRRMSSRRRAAKTGAAQLNASVTPPRSPGDASGVGNAATESASLWSSWFAILREILNPQNIAHREINTGDEDDECDDENGDDRLGDLENAKTKCSTKKGKGKGMSTMGKGNTLSRVIPTLQHDHSLDLNLDGSLPLLSFSGKMLARRDTELESSTSGNESVSVVNSLDDDSVEIFPLDTDFESTEHHYEQGSSLAPMSVSSHRYTESSYEEHKHSHQPSISSSSSSGSRYNGTEHTSLMSEYDRLAVSDVADDSVL